MHILQNQHQVTEKFPILDSLGVVSPQPPVLQSSCQNNKVRALLVYSTYHLRHSHPELNIVAIGCDLEGAILMARRLSCCYRLGHYSHMQRAYLMQEWMNGSHNPLGGLVIQPGMA